jgi:hypothetical protein
VALSKTFMDYSQQNKWSGTLTICSKFNIAFSIKGKLQKTKTWLNSLLKDKGETHGIWGVPDGKGEVSICQVIVEWPWWVKCCRVNKSLQERRQLMSVTQMVTPDYWVLIIRFCLDCGLLWFVSLICKNIVKPHYSWILHMQCCLLDKIYF